MSFLIAATEDGWSIPPVEFREALQRQWPHAVVRLVDDPASPYALTWETPDHQPVWSGSFDRAGDSLVVDGALEGSADVAVWFRGLVPEHVPLVFCDEGYNADVTVTPGMTAAEVARQYLERAK